MTPVKVEKLLPTDYKFIEWVIHNVCNYDCSFCDTSNKDGSTRWKTLEQYKFYADKLIKLCDGKPVWFQFTGGEPTLFPELLELMQHVKDSGAYVSLISNGSRTLRWWEELKNKKCIDYLFITCHVDQLDSFQHIISVLNLFQTEKVQTTCMITHTANSIDKAIEARKLIEKSTGAVIIFKAMMIPKYDIYSLYTDSQMAEVLKETSQGIFRPTKVKPSYPKEHKMLSDMLVTFDDGTTKVMEAQHLMKTKQNNFYEWDCAVGIDTMRIVGDKIYRGVCCIGGVQYSLDDDIKFSDTYIKCDMNVCFCTTDIVTTKIK